MSEDKEKRAVGRPRGKTVDHRIAIGMSNMHFEVINNAVLAGGYSSIAEFIRQAAMEKAAKVLAR